MSKQHRSLLTATYHLGIYCQMKLTPQTFRNTSSKFVGRIKVYFADDGAVSGTLVRLLDVLPCGWDQTSVSHHFLTLLFIRIKLNSQTYLLVREAHLDSVHV